MKAVSTGIACPNCHVYFMDPLALFSIKNVGRCPNCQKKWEALPENNPDFKKFEVTYRVEEYTIIYAKDEDAAIEEFESNYEYDDYDIREIKK